MIDVELRNIKELKKQNFETFLSSDSLIDVVSKQIVLSTSFDEWSLTFFADETFSIIFDSQLNF